MAAPLNAALLALAAVLLCRADTAAIGAPLPPARSSPGISGTVAFDVHILVDQFGYRPRDPKVAVIRNPRVGYDIANPFTPGDRYEVRRAADGGTVFAGAPVAWNKGATEASSGDQGWWFDFSSIDTPGIYYIYDLQRQVRSATFRIDDRVYVPILKAAVRMYFYQRSGFAKRPAYAGSCWADDAAYLGPNQDVEARDITAPDDRSRRRDLRGGWFDAGDTNKYVTFAAEAVHQLLTAYQNTPDAFTDDFGIPESGNGIPDILDEIKWETDWLKRMQYPDGSVALKVGEIVYAPAAPPSSDHNVRYYIPACTSSTIATAGMFAHAAYVFGRIPLLRQEAADLQRRALLAWNDYQRIPAKQTHCDSNVIHSGNADWTEDQQAAEAVVAAVYLFAITGDGTFDQYVQSHYRDTRPYHDAGWSRYNPEQGEALLFYTTLPTADAGLRARIQDDKRDDIRRNSSVYGFAADDDLYRASMADDQYHWGSNRQHANYGNTNLDAITYGIPGSDPGSYRQRALEILHYFDGVNPFAMVYLSNMYPYGATRSANEIYHTWFAAGSRWSDALTSTCGPAPGYLPGGPNAHAAQDGVPAYLAPPTGQPPQKSYRDWNRADPEKSWAVTEPGIYYQSSFVELLSRLVR